MYIFKYHLIAVLIFLLTVQQSVAPEINLVIISLFIALISLIPVGQMQYSYGFWMDKGNTKQRHDFHNWKIYLNSIGSKSSLQKNFPFNIGEVFKGNLCLLHDPGSTYFDLAENTLKKFHQVSSSQIDLPTWTKQVNSKFRDRTSLFSSLNFT